MAAGAALGSGGGRFCDAEFLAVDSYEAQACHFHPSAH
jgi:hypothetical protein